MALKLISRKHKSHKMPEPQIANSSNPGSKNSKIILGSSVLIVLIAALLILFNREHNSNQSKSISKNTDQGQSKLVSQLTSTTSSLNFGVSGIVKSVGANQIVITAGEVKDVNNSHVFVPEDKNITISKSTTFVKIATQGSKTTQEAAKLSDIKVGMNIRVVTKQNIFTNNTLTADQIQIPAQ